MQVRERGGHMFLLPAATLNNSSPLSEPGTAAQCSVGVPAMSVQCLLSRECPSRGFADSSSGGRAPRGAGASSST